MYKKLFSSSMFHSLYKKLLSSPSTTKNAFFPPQTQSLKFFTNSAIQHSPTISYLVHKFGLPLDSAIEVSQKVKILSTARSDSVLELFKSYGFTQTLITELVKRRPPLVLADPVKTLQPKLEFLESVGYSKADIAKIVGSDRLFLCRSLQNQITPTFNLLNKFLDNKEILAVLIRMQCGFLSCVDFRIIERNVQVLRDHGVPEINIGKLLTLNAAGIARKNDRFIEIVNMIEEMKFDPSKLSYVHAISVIGGMGKLCWEKKVEAYKSFGWSNDDFSVAFRLNPSCMRTSEEKIEKLMDFYLNKLGLKAADVAKCPNMMVVSLEKRLIPRCSVMQVLLSHGLIRKDKKLTQVFILGKPLFDKRYVNKYQDRAPEVLKAYMGELGYPRLEVLRHFVNGVNI